MEVILRDHVDHVGNRGDVVKVADGYARNYLLPRNLALPATEANKKWIARERKIAEAREGEERGAAEALADRLVALDLTLSRKVGDNDTMYGSVTNADIADLLKEKGFDVDRRLLPDEQWAIEEALVEGAAAHDLVVTTGGTGLTPRDVTPQATRAVVDYEVPGLAEAMRAVGRTATPLADLSRAVVGVRGRCLIVNLPGSPKGALESLEAIVPVLDHALETLAGPYDHAITAPGGQEEGR